MTIDVKKAVCLAFNHFGELYPDESFSGILLEEVEYPDDGNIWKVTIGFDRELPTPADIQAISGQNYKREYRVFTIDADDGEIKSMKTRELQHD